MRQWQPGLGCAAAGYGNANQMSLIRVVSGPRDRSLPMKRVLKHTVIACSVVWQQCPSWLQELFIDGVILHYSANVTFQTRGERTGKTGPTASTLKNLRSDKNKMGSRGGKTFPMEIIHVVVWSQHRSSVVTQDQRDSYSFHSADGNLII